MVGEPSLIDTVRGDKPQFCGNGGGGGANSSLSNSVKPVWISLSVWGENLSFSVSLLFVRGD